jgi:translation initiation factor 3 subunit E
VLSTDAELNTSAHWGKLASDILTGRWDVALEELNTLRDAIDTRAAPALLGTGAAQALGAASPVLDPALAQLHSRTWVVHWSLFVYFNHPQGRTLLLETFLAPTYLNTIQTSCPWVLRYLAAAAILSRKAAAGLAPAVPGAPAQAVSARVRHAIKEVVKVIQTEEYQYQDPITEFLRELYVEFDFERAQKALKEAVEGVLANDFFLGEFKDEFLDCARFLVSEAYVRIHGRVDIE